MSKIAIIGAGAFGTALAINAARGGHDVVLWGRNSGTIDTINAAHVNSDYLPDVTIPASVHATTVLNDIKDAECVLLTVPAQATPDILEQLADHIQPATPLVICSKGLHRDSGKRLDEIVQTWRREQAFALLSGPCFADELAVGRPTAATIASPDIALANRLCQMLATDTFRPYAQDDVIGVALCGALKNVLAIGAGIVAGAGLGENARAAMVTRGMAEIVRLGAVCGAQPDTFMGLSGIGDVFLTCSSSHSRNYSYGYALARNEPLPTQTVEGLPTIAAALHLSRMNAMELPLMQALYDLCYAQHALPDILQRLMARPLKEE